MKRVLTYSVLGVATFLGGLTLSGGMVRIQDWIHDFMAEREAATVLSDSWNELVATKSRLGTPNGQRLLVEFTDYECPYCRRMDGEARAALNASGVSLVILHYPLTRIHPNAEAAARAAICAEGMDHFPEMHSFLMGSVGWQTAADWAPVALAVGIADTVRFKACLADDETTSRLDRDRHVAEQLRVGGTPTFFHRTGRYTSPLTEANMRSLLLKDGTKSSR